MLQTELITRNRANVLCGLQLRSGAAMSGLTPWRYDSGLDCSSVKRYDDPWTVLISRGPWMTREFLGASAAVVDRFIS